MTKHRLDSNKTFSTEVTVRESDKYSNSIYMRFDRRFTPDESRGCNEIFLTVEELEKFGKFLLEQANTFRTKNS